MSTEFKESAEIYYNNNEKLLKGATCVAGASCAGSVATGIASCTTGGSAPLIATTLGLCGFSFATLLGTLGFLCCKPKTSGAESETIENKDNYGTTSGYTPHKII